MLQSFKGQGNNKHCLEMELARRVMLTVDLRMYRMSGIGRYLKNLIPLIIPLLEAESIKVFGDRNYLSGERWSADPRIEILNSRAKIYGIGEQALGWNEVLKKTDLLWVPHYNIPVLYRGRLAVTVHDVCHLSLRESLNSPIKRAYARFLFANVARKADALFCVSRFTSSEVQRYLRVPRHRIHITYPGLDLTWEMDVKCHLESDSCPYFLCVGNVKPNKNLRLLLHAFQQIMNRVPHRLLIVGKLTDLKSADENFVREARSLGDRVRMVGPIGDELLTQYYRGAEALVFPSLCEGFGLPLIEAMSLGCPVLSSNATSLPEVAGDAALYFDPRRSDELAAKLLQISNSKELRAELIEKGHNRSKMFRYETCARQTAEVLNALPN